MVSVRLIAIAILGVFLSCAGASAQTQCNGQFLPGQVCGNGTGIQAQPKASTQSSLFDQSFGSTIGAFLVRAATAWQEQTSLEFALNPVASVKFYGAKGDGVTDDTAAINNAITALVAAGGGTLYFDTGTYCTFTGVSVNSAYVKVMGASIGTNNVNLNAGGAQLSTCGHDATALTLSGHSDLLQDIAINGGILGSTHPALSIPSGCGQCALYNVYSNGGSQAATIAAADAVFFNVQLINSYGDSLLKTLSGADVFLKKVRFDQSSSVVSGCTTLLYQALPVGVWTTGTPYTKCAIVTFNGWYIQAASNGTAGASLSLPTQYGSTSSDGGVTWQLLAPTTFYGVFATDGSTFFADAADITGPFTDSVYLHSTAATYAAGPSGVRITNSFLGQSTSHLLLADLGTSALFVDNTVFGPCTTANSCAGIFSTQGVNALQGVTITNSFFSATANGIQLNRPGGGVNTINATIAGNQIYGMTGTGILIGINATHFTITHNVVGSSTIWGTNAAAITVTAGGSDDYVITANTVAGATTGITDGGTGIHKNVVGNDIDPTVQSYTIGAGQVACGSGTIGTLGATNGRYRVMGKMVYVEAEITITTNGTCAGSILIAIPPSMASAYNQQVVGYEDAISNNQLQARLITNATAFNVANAVGGTYPGATGAHIVVNGWFETQ